MEAKKGNVDVDVAAFVQRFSANVLKKVGEKMMAEAHGLAEYKDLTGNTSDSISCAIYAGAEQVMMMRAKDFDPSIPTPKRGTLGYADVEDDGFAYVERVTNGEMEAVQASVIVDTDGGYGSDKARKILSSFKADPKKVTLDVTTGTEYSHFLEASEGLNVLSDLANPFYVWIDTVDAAKELAGGIR